MLYTYICDKKVCPKSIEFGVANGRIMMVKFNGGCQGNLSAISVLVEGMFIDDAIRKLMPIVCGDKETSCAGELARALELLNYENHKPVT
jgi:uncharacterized protein (TIGR03905 family)